MATAHSVKPAVSRMTTAEFLAGPEDKRKVELLYGELVVSPSPTTAHNDLLHNLGEVLRRWARHHKLGSLSYDVDMILDEANDLIYRPDLFYLAKEHENRRRGGRLFGAADLCIEIASLNDKPRVQRAKYRDYARHGVAWYWIVNALGEEPFLEENELAEGEYTARQEITGDNWFQPTLFPGLEFRLAPLIDGDLKAAVKGKTKRLM